MPAESGRIRIGIQTAYSAPSPLRPFEYAVANGFDAFEWFPDRKEDGSGWDEYEMAPDTRSFIRNAAMARDIAMSVHVPWQANPLKPEGLDETLKDVSFARDIGATLINIHLYSEKGPEAYARAIVPLMRATGEAKIRLAIENTPFNGPEDFNDLFRILFQMKSVPMWHVGMCLDVGHANLYCSTQNDYLGYLDRLEEAVPIIHLHLHENYGDADTHLVLFTGPSAEDPSGMEGLVKRIKRRGYSGAVILEQWPEPPSLLNQARDRLRRMLYPAAESNEMRPAEGRR